MLLNWERIALRTVYTDAATPIPVGVPVARVHLAGDAPRRPGVAATPREPRPSAPPSPRPRYRVLRHYYPALGGKLAADRAASLASVRSGPAKRFGVKVGKRAARGVLRERAGDHYLDPTIHYTLPPGDGVWQPTPPATDMLGAWIGSLRHLVVKKHVKVDGRTPSPAAPTPPSSRR